MSDLEEYSRQIGGVARNAGERAALAGEDREWADRALNAISGMAIGSRFDADTIRGIVGPPPSSGAVGAVIRVARGRGWIRCVGFGVSSRPSRRLGTVRTWERTR